jgi:Na+/H+ antiporter NhaA
MLSLPAYPRGLPLVKLVLCHPWYKHLAHYSHFCAAIAYRSPHLQALVVVVPFMPALVVVPSHLDAPHTADSEPVFGHEHIDSVSSLGTLRHFEATLRPFVELVVLGLFGLVNAGASFEHFGVLTYVVLGSLVLGKTLGILCW